MATGQQRYVQLSIAAPFFHADVAGGALLRAKMAGCQRNEKLTYRSAQDARDQSPKHSSRVPKDEPPNRHEAILP